MKTILIILTAITLITPVAHAQERTAGANLQNQQSWSALHNLADQANKNSNTAHTRLNQIERCAAKGMLYGPLAANKDNEGCVKPFVDESAMSGKSRLQCRVVSNSGPGPYYTSHAGCNNDETLTGGGAQSETVGTHLCGGQGHSYIHASLPSGNSWVVDGYRPEGGEACTAAYAICCKIIN